MSTTVTTSRRANPSKVFYWLQDEEVHNLYGFMGGFVDAAGYIKFHGLFTSSITGNLVAAMASVYSSYGILSRVMLAIGFCLGAVFASSIQLRLKLFKGWSTRWLLIFTSLAQIITTAVAILFGMLYDKYMNDGDALRTWRLIFVSTIISASMGIQNSAVKDNFSSAPSTTVVTMLLVTLSSQGAQALLYYLASLGLVDLNREGQPRPDNYYQSMVLKENETTAKMIASARHLLSFLVGGVIGAVLIHNFTFWSFFCDYCDSLIYEFRSVLCSIA
jgi:uncharacterized membrane protein YoaK (UPF0700 family)